MPHLFCDGEHGLMPCEKGEKNDGAKLRHVRVVRGVPSRFNRIWEEFRVRPDPEPSPITHLAPPNVHLFTGALRPTERKGPDSAVTDSRRKRRIETRRRLPGGRIVAATKGTPPISFVFYLSGHSYDSRAARVCDGEEKISNFRF